MGEEQPPGNSHIFVQKHLQERYRYKTKKQYLSLESLESALLLKKSISSIAYTIVGLTVHS